MLEKATARLLFDTSICQHNVSCHSWSHGLRAACIVTINLLLFVCERYALIVIGMKTGTRSGYFSSNLLLVKKLKNGFMPAQRFGA
jgi:hypothetical protein